MGSTLSAMADRDRWHAEWLNELSGSKKDLNEQVVPSLEKIVETGSFTQAEFGKLRNALRLLEEVMNKPR